MKFINNYLEEGILILIYTSMLLIATAQVFFRYVINLSLSWSQDLLTYLLIWSVFVGISLAIKRGKHIKVELAYIILPKKFQYPLRLYANGIFILFCSFISYYSILKIHKLLFINPQISESTGLAIWIIQASVPFGLLLSIVRLIQDSYRIIKNHSNGGEKICP